jgi:hypothetical protein
MTSIIRYDIKHAQDLLSGYQPLLRFIINSVRDYFGVCREGLLACPQDRQQASIHVEIKAGVYDGECG